MDGTGAVSSPDAAVTRGAIDRAATTAPDRLATPAATRFSARYARRRPPTARAIWLGAARWTSIGVIAASATTSQPRGTAANQRLEPSIERLSRMYRSS